MMKYADSWHAQPVKGVCAEPALGTAQGLNILYHNSKSD